MTLTWPVLLLIWCSIAALVLFFLVMFLASRYRRCSSDQILVIYGRVGKNQTARCIHGGGAFVWPLIQDYAYMSLTPMTITIPLENALSLQNIRINVPSTFTVGISTEPAIMNNAAERLLRLTPHQIEEMAKEIIFGQLRLTVASLTIEQINQDRESFLEAIRKNVEPELNKIGLILINVNITDITDGSNYIESIGKKAAAEAINTAKIDVAEQEKIGAIGEAQANRERTIRVAENYAEAEKGQKKAEADKRIYIQQQEAEAVKGEKKAVAEQRIFVQQQEALAVSGENKAKADIAESEAQLAIRRAEALRKGEVAKRQAEAEIQKAQYLAEQQRLTAEVIVKQEIEKQKVEIEAEALAERYRREAKGQADAILAKYEAEAKGLRQVLESKAAGYRMLVESCNGDARSAATLLMIEKLEEIVSRQVEAIKNLKIEKITVWDSGGSDKGGSSTANFLSSLIKSLPPLQEIAAMAGVELPAYLGKMSEERKEAVAAHGKSEEAASKKTT
ncbi:MAG TPA: SPFH domain-containing protein [Anaerohalosphaeraceae bacterium]|nr:SPFH domain-containing protein [Anaerohalosphaeraceae bacterium]HOL88113.1 SPFH domain-containing protein [Anaerohalosphaeraceae bacterium]HPP55361.1 SPFH domain-containing protein [Anaerohalosphaeraceae bacterium]